MSTFSQNARNRFFRAMARGSHGFRPFSQSTKKKRVGPTEFVVQYMLSRKPSVQTVGSKPMTIASWPEKPGGGGTGRDLPLLAS